VELDDLAGMVVRPLYWVEVGAGVRPSLGTPTPRVFCCKSLELLENKEVDGLSMAKEFARV
jgi:hypothetical protein